jgi:hypothetical protein
MDKILPITSKYEKPKLTLSNSDLAPSKKVTGGERQKAKGKRQND